VPRVRAHAPPRQRRPAAVLLHICHPASSSSSEKKDSSPTGRGVRCCRLRSRRTCAAIATLRARGFKTQGKGVGWWWGKKKKKKDASDRSSCFVSLRLSWAAYVLVERNRLISLNFRSFFFWQWSNGKSPRLYGQRLSKMVLVDMAFSLRLLRISGS
jgi:hypothetical protein